MEISYDRGTILIQTKRNSNVNIGELSAVQWDPRVRKFRAPAYLYSKLRSELSERNIKFRETVWNIQRTLSQCNSIELRSYQQEAIHSWRKQGHRGIIVLPTGSGKTRVGIAATAALSKATLVLVPTRVLMYQWAKEFGRYYNGSIGLLGDGLNKIESLTIATFESAYRNMAWLGNRFELLVIDEVHHFIGGVRSELLEMALAPNRVGLTATLPIHKEEHKEIRLLVGPLVFEMGMGELCGSYLSKFEHITLHVDLTSDERKTYDSEIDYFYKFLRQFQINCPFGNWKDLSKNAAKNEVGRRALVGWRRANSLLAYPNAKEQRLSELLIRYRTRKLFVFTANTKTAYQVARSFLIMPLTSQIKKKEREDMLNRFQLGEIRALVSCRVLNEGIDVPDAEIAIILGGTLGEREHIQRIGRLLRPSPRKNAIIYELVCNNTLEVKQSKIRTRSLGAGISSLFQ